MSSRGRKPANSSEDAAAVYSYGYGTTYICCGAVQVEPCWSLYKGRDSESLGTVNGASDQMIQTRKQRTFRNEQDLLESRVEITSAFTLHST